ncbi:seminal plasma protein HSP-1-like [Montipora capricornis]|uniref:seminal plasma protein HSP-1-like n=1 Tax=Montipora capricornis TaxID=246305 RepID=UPI0035F1FC79
MPEKGKEHNFKNYKTSRINSLGVPYDYGSVMHYGAYYFSKNGKRTIVAKRAGVTIGQRNGPSGLDCKQMNLLYKCTTTGCTPTTTSNKCCAIPFEYRGRWYFSCTSTNHHRDWCSLDRVYKGRWENCETTCCQRKTTSKQCCAIPFKYRGTWYYSCTTANHHRAWCSLDPVYKGSWENCQ